MKQIFSLTVLILVISCSEKYDPIQSLQSNLEYLASDSLEGREVGTKGEKLAADFLVEKMQALELEGKGQDGFIQNFYFKLGTNPHEKAQFSNDPIENGKTASNVLAYKDNPGDKIIVIGAHYDHLGRGGISSMDRGSTEIHNGADDNGSGTAALLHLAKTLGQLELNHDLLFFAITGEESGLWGSNHYTKNPTVDLDKVNFMINMDMIGRMDSTRGLAIYGTGTTDIWDETINTANADSLKIIKKESGRGPSDHTSFYLEDIPVLHFFTGQHEDYHKPSDDVDKINYAGILQVTDMIERIVVSLDDSEKLPFQKTKDESTNTPRFTVTLGVMPDYMFEGDGMMIADVSPDKPAITAGIEKGDIVIQLGDSTVNDMMGYMRALSVFKAGDKTSVIVRRNQEELTFSVEF